MKIALTLVILGAAFVAVSSSTQPAAAADDVSVYYGLGHDGYSGINRRHTSRLVPTPPYFALHPPVYYSYVVPRPYGYSPFAYPAYVTTPEIKKPKIMIHDNPFAKPPKPSKTRLKTTSTQRGGIRTNPYADSATIASVAD